MLFRNLKHYNSTTKEQTVTNHERENELGRVTRKRRKRNVVDDEGGGIGEVKQIRNDKTNKYQKLGSELLVRILVIMIEKRKLPIMLEDNMTGTFYLTFFFEITCLGLRMTILILK